MASYRLHIEIVDLFEFQIIACDTVLERSRKLKVAYESQDCSSGDQHHAGVINPCSIVQLPSKVDDMERKTGLSSCPVGYCKTLHQDTKMAVSEIKGKASLSGPFAGDVARASKSQEFHRASSG